MGSIYVGRFYDRADGVEMKLYRGACGCTDGVRHVQGS